MLNKEQILKEIAKQQEIQMTNSPKSAVWQNASKRILELGTLLNDGVAPTDAEGR